MVTCARQRQYSDMNSDFLNSFSTLYDVDATLSNDKTDTAHLDEQISSFVFTFDFGPHHVAYTGA